MSSELNDDVWKIIDDIDGGVGTYVQLAESRLRDEVVKAESRIAESLLNVVTILGVFITIAGFLGASGVLVVFQSTFKWWQDAIILLEAGLSSVMFFAVLRQIVVSGLSGAIRRASQLNARVS